MLINGWRYYNHAAIPTTAPHEEPDLSPIQSKQIWKLGDGKTPLLARWTTDFDCGYETNWWYVIKDAPFDISALKAKRRYEINKGLKNFQFRRINHKECAEEIYDVTVAAYSAYPQKYRPTVQKENFLRDITGHKGVFYAVFNLETNEMGAYAIIVQNGKCLSLSVLKSRPEMEKLGVNAALVHGILCDLEDQLNAGYYICDGERSTLHETAFQDYLEKYFGFRKAYCRLNVKYKPVVAALVRMIYPCRRAFEKMQNINILNKITAVMKMEEIVRKQD